MELIVHDPAVTEVRGLTATQLAALSTHLSFFAKGYRYDWRFKQGLWDGKIHLLTPENRFPTGLASRVRQWGMDRDLPVRFRTLHDPYQDEPASLRDIQWNDKDPGPLRDYQVEAVEAAATAERGVIWMPTGSGKTEVIAKLIHVYNQPALVIVPTRALLIQTIRRLNDRLPGVALGAVGDGRYLFGADVTVALFQTLARHRYEYIEDLSRIRVLINDEAHHVSADTWIETLGLCPAPFRFGFSATPYLKDGRDLLLEAATGPLIYKYEAMDAVAAGHLKPPKMEIAYYRPTRQLEDLGSNEWSKIYKQGIVEDDHRNQMVAERALDCVQSHGKTLVLVKEIAHGEHLRDLIARRTPKVTFLSGKEGSTVRELALVGFQRNRYDVMVATTIFDEGIDVPTVSAVVLAVGGKAEHKTIQRIGRGMRRAGADWLRVVDFWDTAHPILQHHSAQRQRTYERAGWNVMRDS